MKLFAVLQRLALANGSSVALVAKVFSEEGDAKSYAQTVQAGIAGLMKSQLVEITGAGEARDTGLGLSAFLGDLGVIGVKHEVVPLGVTTSNLVVPEGPRVILSS